MIHTKVCLFIKLLIVAHSKSAALVNKPDDSPLTAIQNSLKPMTEVYFKRAKYDYNFLKTN